MTVAELIEHLKGMPQDALVIYASDEEGNSFHRVEFMPTNGKFNEQLHDFEQKPELKDSGLEPEDFLEYSRDYSDFEGESAVCIN